MSQSPRQFDNRFSLAALQWQYDAGCDEVIAEIPTDWRTFAASGPVSAGKQNPAVKPAPSLSAKIQPLTPPAAAASPAAYAINASSLSELKEQLLAFEGCALKKTAMNLVFGDGNPEAGLMLIGEAPGADEDRQGRPFVGRSGQLLDRMLAAVGLDRSLYYITNIVPWRPPGNRTPTDAEIAALLPFTLRHIELARPKIVVTLGAPATKTLLDSSEGIMKLRGRWADFKKSPLLQGVRLLPMLHPASLLRQPANKALAWADLLVLKAAIASQAAEI